MVSVPHRLHRVPWGLRWLEAKELVVGLHEIVQEIGVSRHESVADLAKVTLLG